MSANPDRMTASRESGPHSKLKLLEGKLRGTSRVWFEPGKLADESPIEGAMRLVLDGRFLLHEYKTSMGGKPIEGMALYGYHFDRERWEAAWVDSFHSGSAIMFSHGGKPDGFNVLGSYPAPGGPDWGWRTELEASPEGPIVRHYNVTPDGAEALAVEIRYTRV